MKKVELNKDIRIIIDEKKKLKNLNLINKSHKTDTDNKIYQNDNKISDNLYKDKEHIKKDSSINYPNKISIESNNVDIKKYLDDKNIKKDNDDVISINKTTQRSSKSNKR